MISKFYEFFNGLIVRLDKVVDVTPVQSNFTNRSNVYFTIRYDIRGENILTINKYNSYFRHLIDTNPDKADEFTKSFTTRYTIPRPEEDAYNANCLKEFKENEYADFIKAWKEYNDQVPYTE